MRLSARHLSALAPLVVLLAGAALFIYGVRSGAPKRPSALVGKPAPSLSLAALPGTNMAGLAPADLGGGIVVVNFWASWCAPCKLEHGVLMALSKRTDIMLIGVDWKDDPELARAYLAHLGNPFAKLGADRDGRAGIEWGIGGVPETFLVGADGRIIAHQEGPLDAEALRRLGLDPLW